MTQSRKDVDGGWAWMVFLASFMNLLLASGIAFVSGIFQKLFLEHFHQSVAYTAWVTALFSSFMQLAGPLAGWLTSVTNCRVTVMVGGALMSGGLAASSFATSLNYLFVSFGLMAGIGLGLMYTPSIVIVNFFFDRRRTVFMGLALSASGLGITWMPVVSHILMDLFSWQETMMMLAAITAHVCVFGAVMFPVHEQPSSCFRRCQGYHHPQSDDLENDLCGKGSVFGSRHSLCCPEKLNHRVTESRHSLCCQEKLERTDHGLSCQHKDPSVKLGSGDVDASTVQGTKNADNELTADADDCAERPLMVETKDGDKLTNGESAKKTSHHNKPTIDLHQRLLELKKSQHQLGSGKSLNEVSHRLNGTGGSSPHRQHDRRKLSYSAHNLDRLHHHHHPGDHHPLAPSSLVRRLLTVGDRDTPQGSHPDVRAITIFSSFLSLHSGVLPVDVLPKDVDSTKTSLPDVAEQNGGVVENTGEDGGGGGGGAGRCSSNWMVCRNAAFLFLCLQLFLSNMACGIFSIHLPAFSQQRGLDDQEITLVFSMYGVGVFVSRILLGALGHDERVDKLAAYFGVQIIASCVMASLPWTQNLAGVVALTILMGIYYASGYSLLTSLTISVVGLPSLAFAFGLEMICAGLGFLVAPPLAGWIVDETGDYDNSMYLGGFTMFLSALCALCLTCGRSPGSPPVGYLSTPCDIQEDVELGQKEHNGTC